MAHNYNPTTQARRVNRDLSLKTKKTTKYLAVKQMKTFDTTPTRECVNHTKCWLTPIMMIVKGERKNSSVLRRNRSPVCHWWSCKMEQPQ